MKKNISINISGIIFHIEEDGYETLRQYLDSIKRYFASYTDSSEIIADIESRIAEIFLAKLNEGKQVITAEDVASLIATMGSVNDFKAAEEQEFAGEVPPRQQAKTNSKTARKLVRDYQRKILGGVCAGFAHYFNIDPVWPRLLFALLVLGSYGSLLIIYIILWIVLPAAHDLEEEATVKKMFRDPERKVIGGVASGVAAFFGADLTLIRLLFVIFTFVGGIGLLAYIILWIVLPQAKTITEKMQMQGERVTLSNIESTVKKSLNEKEHDEESALTKVILFPFRLIATIINGLAKALGPVFRVIVDVFRVAIGIAISLTGLFAMLSLLFAVGVILGLFHINDWPWWGNHVQVGLPLEALRNTFPVWTIVSAFLVAFIPALFINLIGNSIIAKRMTFNPLVGWSLFVLFFISVGAVAISIPQVIYSFKERGEYKTETSFALNGKTPVLRMNETDLGDYDMTSVMISGYEGNEIKLVKRFKAQGNTRKVAAENAQMVTYNVVQQDSILLFDSNLTFNPEARFRVQRLEMELYIPYNMPFVIEREMWSIVDNRINSGYYDSNFEKTWRITADGLTCMNCEQPSEQQQIRLRDQYGLHDFSRVDLTGIFDVELLRGEVFAVQLSGPEKEKARYSVFQQGETLIIDYRTNHKKFWERNPLDDDKVKISITMPNLKKLKAKGAGKIDFEGFYEEDVEIDLTGAMKAEGRLEARNLTIELTGATVLELNGRGDFMEANATGASSLRAFGYEADEVIVAARGVSSARVNVSRKLQIKKDLTSSVTHRGDPEVIEK
ncbi:MAG: PspC domain-containing protein [Cyclobacteriaceae bacterium]|nr:PspC domain-containing protein [Cyclobacteriaceae bacterium]